MTRILQRKRLPPRHLNLTRRVMEYDDGYQVPITNMLDSEGEETDDPDEAVVVVGGDDQTGWHALRMEDYEPLKLN